MAGLAKPVDEMGHLHEHRSHRGQPGKPPGHEGQSGGSRVVGVQHQQHRGNYRYRGKCDNERERYEFAE